jgi:CHAD domain-containing protein
VRQPHEASAFVALRLRELDKAIAEAVPRVLGDTDEEALHDLRVAIRRLRVLLKLARPLYSRFLADAVREPFTVFHRATSELRDEEVLEGTLASLALGDAAFHRWLVRRKQRERELRRKTIERLRSGELDAARRKLEALLELPTKPSRRQPLGAFARHAVISAQAKVEKLRDTPTSDAAGLHELRIAYKNLRYAAELLRDALPPDLRAVAEPAKKLQTLLGDLHDADVAIMVARTARNLAPATRAKVLRALRALRDKRVRDYLEVSCPVQAKAPARRAPRRRKSAPPLRATLSRP